MKLAMPLTDLLYILIKFTMTSDREFVDISRGMTKTYRNPKLTFDTEAELLRQ